MVDDDGDADTMSGEDDSAKVLMTIGRRKVRTQKAYGVIRCKTEPAVRGYTLAWEVFNSVKQTNKMVDYTSPMFARPCPVKPVHGFLESRPITKVDELKDLIREVRKLDPDGEVLVGPYIQADWNLIVTPNEIAIGPSNDGATGGYDCLSLPVAYSELTWAQSIVGGGSAPYVEVVVKDGGAYVTQVRAGPTPPSPRIVWTPRDMVVMGVVRAEGDLLEWQEKAKTFRSDIIVWQPGGTMLSHYSIHCVMNGIPISFSDVEPTVGMRLIPGDTQPEMWDRVTYERGIEASMKYDLLSRRYCRRALNIMLFTLHNWTALRYTRHGSFLLGFASGVFVRLGYAACLGEYRHAFNSSPRRETVYKECLEGFDNFIIKRTSIGYALWAFDNLEWRSSVGGPKWGMCTRMSMDVEKIAILDPESTENDIVSKLNEGVTLAHNCGWWFNKFTDEKFISKEGTWDSAASGNVLFLIKSAVAIRELIDEYFDYERIELIGCIRESPAHVIAREDRPDHILELKGVKVKKEKSILDAFFKPTMPQPLPLKGENTTAKIYNIMYSVGHNIIKEGKFDYKTMTPFDMAGINDLFLLIDLDMEDLINFDKCSQSINEGYGVCNSCDEVENKTAFIVKYWDIVQYTKAMFEDDDFKNAVSDNTIFDLKLHGDTNKYLNFIIKFYQFMVDVQYQKFINYGSTLAIIKNFGVETNGTDKGFLKNMISLMSGFPITKAFEWLEIKSIPIDGTVEIESKPYGPYSLSEVKFIDYNGNEIKAPHSINDDSSFKYEGMDPVLEDEEDAEEDAAEEEYSMGTVPALNKEEENKMRVQFNIRGSVAHFQIGKPGAYKKFDIDAGDGIDEWEAVYDNLTTNNSLAGTPTQYAVLVDTTGLAEAPGVDGLLSFLGSIGLSKLIS